jgi:hypothetical protein
MLALNDKFDEQRHFLRSCSAIKEKKKGARSKNCNISPSALPTLVFDKRFASFIT